MHRNHNSKQAYLQGDILPIVKHLAFAGRFRRIDLQPIVHQIRRKQSRIFDFGIWIYRPREANVIADYLAGLASQYACNLSPSQDVPLEVYTPAPYRVAIAAGAVVLEERPCEATVLVLTEVSNTSLRSIPNFLESNDNQKYRREVENYLAGTANLTRPRLVEYTATACDGLGRLYGRGPCAQRLPRKVRLFLFGATHQEIDMIGSFYEILRRLSVDIDLPNIQMLRSTLTDLLGLIPTEHRHAAVKKHPLIVMNSGAATACAMIERQYGITCPDYLRVLSLRIERAAAKVVNDQLPQLRPQFDRQDKGATFRALEWYEAHVMVTFYKELTRRIHVVSAIWLHDGIWVPKDIPLAVIRQAEQVMLHRLQIDPTPVFRINDLAEELDALPSPIIINSNMQESLRHKENNNAAATTDGVHDAHPIRWNTNADTTGFATFVERVAKRRRKA